MPIISPSNIEYLGSKPNFTRDSYDTLEAMQAALEAGHIDEGHLTYCRETGITYRAVRSSSGLVWENFIGDLRDDLTEKILEDERVTAEALWDLNTRLESAKEDLGSQIQNNQAETTEAIQGLSDRIDTLQEDLEEQIQAVQSEASEAVQNLSDQVDDLQEELEEQIQTVQSETSGALQDLDTRIGNIESNLSGETDGGIGDKLEEVWNWYDVSTHIPALSSSWVKKDTANLRQGTQHTYTVFFDWSWADRAGATGVMYVAGGDRWTERSFDDIGIPGASAGSSWSTDVVVNLGSEPVTLQSKFNNPDSDGFSEYTVTPMTPKRTWSASGLPNSWVSLSLTGTESLTLKVIGSNLPSSAVGNKVVGNSGEVLRTISEVTDSDIVVTETTEIDPSVTQAIIMTWQDNSGNTIDSYSYTPQPGFFVISNQTNAWNGSESGLVAFIISATGGYQTWAKSASTVIPETEYTAGSTAVYLSQYDIRDLGVKSLAYGSDTWITISGFSESGTVTYLGKTYYYRLNPNIGAGIFSFKFA